MLQAMPGFVALVCFAKTGTKQLFSTVVTGFVLDQVRLHPDDDGHWPRIYAPDEGYLAGRGLVALGGFDTSMADGGACAP